MNGLFSFDLGGLLGWPLVNVLLAVLTTSFAGLLAARLAEGRPAALRSGLLLAALLLAAAAPLASAASWYGRLGLWPAPVAAGSAPPPAAPPVAVVPFEPLPPTPYSRPFAPPFASDAPSYRKANSANDNDVAEVPVTAWSVFDSRYLRLVFDMLLLTWLVGAGIGFARLAKSGLRLRRFASMCRPAASPRALAALASAAKKVGLASPPRLAVAPAASAPAAFGLLRPVVALPEGLVDELDDDELEAVFLHEAGHTAGGDAWVSLLQAVLAAAYWPLLPLHWLSARLSAAREELCDDYVVAAQGDGRRFAEVLVRLAERAASPPPSPALALLDPGPTGLELRIRRLLRKDRIPMTNLTSAARLGLAWFAAALFASATFAQLRADAPPAAAPSPEAPRAADPAAAPSAADPDSAADPNVDPTTTPPLAPKRGRMPPPAPRPPAPPQPPAPPGAPPPPLPPGKPSPFGSQPAAPGFVPDPAAPRAAVPQPTDPAHPAADRMNGLVADPDFWSKEGAKRTHEFSPAEIGWLWGRGDPAGDVRTPGRLRWQKLRCDVDGKANFAAAVPEATALQAAAGAFAWLESKSADSSEARRFDVKQGFTHYSVTPRQMKASSENLWFEIEDATPGRVACGLNLRWNTVLKKIDQAEHWGAVREVPAAVLAALAAQAADPDRRPKLKIPAGNEEVPGSYRTTKAALRYREQKGAADLFVEQSTAMNVKHVATGRVRPLTLRTVHEEVWDVAASPPRVLKSTLVYSTPTILSDFQPPVQAPHADPNRAAP